MNVPLAVIRGANDVASAAALALYRAGFAVLILESPAPAVSRRGQSFADAMFDGAAELEGVTARRVTDPAAWRAADDHGIVLSAAPFPDALAGLQAAVLVDARMRKRAVHEDQRDLRPWSSAWAPISSPAATWTWPSKPPGARPWAG